MSLSDRFLPRTSPAQPEYGPSGWVVIVPVKPTAVGKSRLTDAAPNRAALARALALDTIVAAAAATAVQRVIVVTEDADIAAAVRRMPHVDVVREGDQRGLDAAIATGAAAAGPDTPRAALLGDLPALRPFDLDTALEAAEAVERGVVADAEGEGSTLVTARAGATWISAFGEDSFSRHKLLGCTPLDVPPDSTLRRDVDTAEQLAEASLLGLGARTAAVLGASAA
ncbi:2-phospho-L-lactate guanylyltransferase [Microbacterium sp. P06]|uniref:2-phospho-L-lactate guanylyltransferase n=1 Tax=Microbacterium sp. P06 TaxID=3366949 RepID=UPI003747578A